MIIPAVRHFWLTTTNLPAMVAWYARVFGMSPRQPFATPGEAPTPSRWLAAWSSNDHADPRITMLSLTALSADQEENHGKGPQRIPFECATLDDLLGAYRRLKALGIEPGLAMHHGFSIVFYYEDPDRHSVQLTLDNRRHSQRSNAEAAPAQGREAQRLGSPVDPEQMVAARLAGMSVAELNNRAYAGDFSPPCCRRPGPGPRK